MPSKPRNRVATMGAALAAFVAACGSGEPGDDPGPPPPPTVVFASTGDRPAHPIASNGMVFWSETSQSPVMSRPVSGGTATQLAYHMGTPQGLAVHGADVIWVDGQFRRSPAGCTGRTSYRAVHRTVPSGATTLLGVGDDCSALATSGVVVAGEWAWWVSSTGGFQHSLQRSSLAGGGTSTMATSILPIVSLATDGSYVYWMENLFPGSSAAVRRLPVAGGPVMTLVSGFDSRNGGIAVDGHSVFYAVADYPAGDSLMAVPAAGGEPDFLGLATSTPLQLAVDAIRLYWTHESGISAQPLAGGPVEVLATTAARPFALSLRDADVVWSDWRPELPQAGGAIRSVPKTGGAVTILSAAAEAPRQLASNATNIWFSQGDDDSPTGMGRVARIAATGGSADPITAGIVADSPPIVVSASDIIIADSLSIWRAPRAGGLLQLVAAVNAPAYSLATDGTSVYWLDRQLRIYRAPLTGGAPALLAALPHVDRVGRLSYVGGRLYWSAGPDGVLSMPASGGDPSLAATTPATPVDLVVDDPGIYSSTPPFMTMNSRTTGLELWRASFSIETPYAPLAVDATSVFVLTKTGMFQVNKSTAEVDTLSVAGPVGDYPPGISTDAGVVYWTDPSSREILSVRAFGTDDS